MKLKNKLLPLVGIAATAAVVTPLVTSCKSSYDMVDITKGYTPKTKSSVAGELTQQEATQTYMEDVIKNPEIFKEDFIYGVYNKVIKTKNNFLNSPTNWEYDDDYAPSGYWGFKAASFKLNSLKAGVSTPTFGKTEIAYPGEPKITYPTVSFEYKIQIDYSYEYLGRAYNLGVSESTPWSYDGESDGYHARTIQLETNIKYTNVPFLAIAHTDQTGLNTYWQVSPLDNYKIYSTEDSIETLNYYNQAYMFQYMSDDWSIDINASANIEEKTASSGDTETTTKNPSYSININTWSALRQLMAVRGKSRYHKLNPGYLLSSNGKDEELIAGEDWAIEEKLTEDVPYDLANYMDMTINLANFGFESYYLQSVAQKPEVQANGNMQGYSVLKTATDTKASFGAFYLPQLFNGTVKLYAGKDAEGKPTGDIVLNTLDLEEESTPLTLTIAAGTPLAQNETYKWQYGVNDQTLTWDAESKTPTAGQYYNFVLPKTIVAEFTLNDTAKTTWTQDVYLNQYTLPVMITAGK